MRVAIAEIESISPYSQSKHYNTEKLEREIPKDYEARTWRGRCHTDSKGNCYIPPMAIKNCIAEAAKYMGIQIPGKGKSNYTKHFEAGVMVLDGIDLNTHIDDVKGEWLFVPSDGRRGGSKRVEKCFPLFESWHGIATFHIIDEIITEDVFQKHLSAAGSFIGLGRFRPRNNGFYGRFKINEIEYREE